MEKTETKKEQPNEKNKPKLQINLKDMNFRKWFAILGIILVIAHLTYFFIRPYSFILFIVGFGIIYMVFVYPIKKHNQEMMKK